MLLSPVIAGIVIITLYVRPWASDGEGEMVSLENSIIINGIRMESDEPMDDEDGSVILDSSFESTIGESAPEGKERDVEKSIAPTPGQIMESLRKQDRRWHLVKYRIKKSDNLWSIARRYGVDHKVIIGINAINNPDMLQYNKVIQIPSKQGLYHRVNRGESLTQIARKYKVNVDTIRRQNNLKGSVIMANTKIFIPDATVREPKLELKQGHKLQIARKESKIPAAAVVKQGGKIFLGWPLRGRITSAFGNRKDPFQGKKSFHCGIDISVNAGTPVKAAMDGKVIFSGWKDGYGNMVILRHRGGYITVYAHNSKNNVDADDDVARGNIIALSGNTGATTGAHLHFELRKFLTPLNPLRFLR